MGARNEYGDSDTDGVVIHIYLVYALGLLMVVLPWSMSYGAGQTGQVYGRALKGITILWTISAPFFFFLPDSVDGIYERYLGLIAMGAVVTLAWLFISLGYKLR